MTSVFFKLFIKNYKDTANPDVRVAYGKLAGILGIVSNLLLFVLKLVASILTSSVAVGADAINNLSDASSSIISFVGFKLSQKPADEKHPYGHGRYEYIAALCVAITIILIGIELLKTSVDKIINPKEVGYTLPLIIVLLFSVITKLWLMFFNKKCSRQINSHALYATAMDCRNDCITTAAIIITAIVSYYTGVTLDGWAGVGVSLFILISGIKLIKETLDPIIGSMPDVEYIVKIKDKILSYPKVLGVHDLIIHDYGPSKKFASVHVEMAGEDDVYENHEIIDDIENYFLKHEGLNIIIHYDPVVTNDPSVNAIRRKIEEIVNKIDSRLSIHDFRIVKKDEITNLIFECVVPEKTGIDKDELVEMISQKVYELDKSFRCIITIDEYYLNYLSKKNHD